MYSDKKGIISEKAIPAIKTAIDNTNKLRFQIGFSFIFDFFLILTT